MPIYIGRYDGVADVSYWQNMFIKAATLLPGAMLLFCMECSETQVATSSLND